VSFRLSLFHVSWRRTVQGIAALFLTTIAIGGLYQTVSLFRERSAFPMPGRLVDVGGYEMHIYCTGQGSPAVILDSVLVIRSSHGNRCNRKLLVCSGLLLRSRRFGLQ